MGGNELLTSREFYKGIERLEARFDTTDAKLTGHAERLAVLEAAATALEAAAKKDKRMEHKKTAAWGSAVAGVVLIAVEIIKSVFKP